MSGSDVEHVSCFLDSSRPHHFRRPSSASSNQSFYDAPSNLSLEASFVAPASSPPPSFPTSYRLRPNFLPSHSFAVPTSLSEHPDLLQRQGGRASPDPDDYYRRHQSPLATENDTGVGAGNTLTDGANSQVTAEKTYPTQFQRVSSLPADADTFEPLRRAPGQYRSASDSSYRGLGPKSVRPPPALASTARNRQTSFKDLINRFNQNVDQVLPVPPSVPSTQPSRAASPVDSVDGSVRSRTSSRFRDLHEMSTNKKQPIGRWNSIGSSLQESPEANFPPPLRAASFGSQAQVNQDVSNSPRRQMFGELPKVDTNVNNSNLGIPSHMRRRGSEGSIPSPNPALLDQPDQTFGQTPLTPTAWYLGQTPFLEAVNTGAASSNNHRRVQSDFSRSLSVNHVVPTSLNSHMAVPASSPPSEPGTPPLSPHSKSRIPISSHHTSPVSGSEKRWPSPKASSTFSGRSASQVPLPPKGISRLPKPSSTSPPRMKDDNETTFATSSTARRETGRGRNRPEKNGHMQAYIAAPPPRKSPALRSSRPRQPVTKSGPTTSRSRVVETVSNFQNQANRGDPRNSRTRERRLPELGNVDFATRRQRIQQAFNRTVQENERKQEEAEEQRRVQAEEEQQADAQPLSPDQPQHESIPTDIPSHAEDTATVIEEIVQTCDEEKKPAPETGDSRALPQLHINTHVQRMRVNADFHPMTAMDSPTLGIPMMGNRGPENNKSSNLAPVSAVTAASSDTHVTTFDPEPQVEVPQQDLNTSHRTLLSQIMQIREDSPSSSSCDEPDYSFSDNDERESIPIMLRNTAYFGDSVNGSENHGHRNYYIQPEPPGRPMSNRWSMSSWSSSLRNQHSTDDHCEGSGDELSQVPPSVDDGGMTTQSCSVASSTPPSVSIHHFPGLLPPTELEQKSENSSGRNTMLSDGPSLVRQGGWNSTRVTQLYLEELARGRGNSLSLPGVTSSPEPRRSNTEMRTEEKRMEERRTEEKKAEEKPNSLTDDPVMVPSFEDIAPDQIRHSATLSFRDDWVHASPSIADWMQVAADDECSPVEQRKTATSPLNDGVPTPRLITSSNPQASNDEEVDEGLGLAIHVQSPQELESTEAFPPMPYYPPPHFETQETSSKQAPPQLSSTIDPSQQQYNGLPPVVFAPLGLVHSTGSSDNFSLRRLEPTPSPHAVDSSATSLVPSTSDYASIENQKASPSPEQRRLKKRRHVIKELVDTEYNFGRDMKVVDDIYKGTSSSCLDLSTDDVKILFANSDLVVQFSMGFQDALKTAAKSVYVMPKSQRWASKRSARNSHLNPKNDPASATEPEMSDLEKDRSTFIGQAFVTHMSQMEKVYSDYLKNHDAANKKLQALQRNPKVAIWLKECRDWASDLTTAWDLDSLLVKPVQRILKYPLLLTELLDSTPSDHPDRASLLTALEEVTSISVRINEQKKRADLVGQVVGRKRKESDVRAGLSKAFGRRTEKLRQQVGLSDIFEDKEYDSLSQRLGDGFFQLQVVMRDVEMYTREAQGSMERFEEFVDAIDGFLDVAQSNYADLEGKWRHLKLLVRDIMVTALPDHLGVVRKSVIDPMITLLKLYEGPQRVMRKRDKRLMDYARFKAIKDRGDKPDKKTTEQGEQFVALNETLKDELPKLFGLTAKMMEACLTKFVQIQTTWFSVLQKKLSPAIDAFPDDLQRIINDWAGDFTFSEAQVLSLGICNGSLLADTINLVNFNTPSTGANIGSPRRPSTTSTRVGSTVDESPKVSHDFSVGSRVFQSPSIDSQSQVSTGRHRADSTISGRTSEAPEMPRSHLLQQITSAPASSGPMPQQPINQEPFPSLPRLSLDTPFLDDVANVIGPSTSASENPPTSPGGRYSGFFSSAMPMSDAPEEPAPAAAPVENEPPKEPNVLFLAASIYEFNIDRARREAGYPYLTYVAGEIFDVIAEKGELWLAKNQDDNTRQVGWIWNKHFAKLSG
ncbi:hypothetical protein ASPWEDRAFT_67226 [Aspergillus wentii DTO 134E9]|uniref:Dynamin-binding protein n=1 Tax=Aspergillus wentii DTO 134E9 TaxID=1073089 RepID=A0A1L9RPL2_ASPWE|nr:uncharacterized protein ASPWEDRAFT_67226 [Aspergillus wentii DTO 134E9]OJJ36895.1 hypothetical protein ASPWEDRAFT_67226 [Aspergillus wentii DTO 134E9]